MSREWVSSDESESESEGETRGKTRKKGPLENSIRSRRDVSFFSRARQFKVQVIE